MFTGIIKGVFPVVGLNKLEKLHEITIKLPAERLTNLEIGASIAVNGVCLTVVKFDESGVQFDVMQETLRVTNLAALEVGSMVNIERAARFGDEIGGHLLSGHVHDQVTICDIIHEPNNVTIWFEMNAQVSDYVLPKGYVALNGASLTVGAQVKDHRFCVHLIPETLRLTTFSSAKVGDLVNLEVDSQTQAVVDTVKSYMAQHHG